jgi:hypothetical protein
MTDWREGLRSIPASLPDSSRLRASDRLPESAGPSESGFPESDGVPRHRGGQFRIRTIRRGTCRLRSTDDGRHVVGVRSSAASVRYTMRWCDAKARVDVMLETAMGSLLPRVVTMHTVFSVLAGTSIGPTLTCNSLCVAPSEPPPASSALASTSTLASGDFVAGTLAALDEHPRAAGPTNRAPTVHVPSR